jgi:hypothetical protein
MGTGTVKIFRDVWVWTTTRSVTVLVPDLFVVEGPLETSYDRVFGPKSLRKMIFRSELNVWVLFT